ncbi:MAG TPA: glycosyltransferase [Micromonosporaceae bacterium]
MTAALASAPSATAILATDAVDRTAGTVLFLVADTGGGHRAAAAALTEAIGRHYPGRLIAVECDPLTGPAAPTVLRWVARLYGPLIRWSPWLWGALFHASNSRAGMRLLHSTVLRLAERPVFAAFARHRPVAVVSCHPLTGSAAIRTRAAVASRAPVVTVVTDLVTLHAAWRNDQVDRLVLAPAAAFPPSSDHHRVVGLPVSGAFTAGPPTLAERAELRRRYGVDRYSFVVLVTGGGEGAGGIARRTKALLQHCPDVAVMVVCGRNDRLRRRLDAIADRHGGRLSVYGFVDDMADRLRCADVVVTKAGPGTIAEATCCGTPLILTSHLPGQERGNTDYVVRAGAGRYAPSVAALVREVRRIQRDPAALTRLRSASAALGRPHAASSIAALIADSAGVDVGTS